MLLKAAVLSSAALLLFPFHSLAADVKVEGAGNVGIGQMTGGTVNVGLTPQEAKNLSTATGQELIKQLNAIVARFNAQATAGSRDDKISLGVAEAFLATLKGKKVAQTEWPVVFGELTREYLQLGDRIKATPVTSEAIKGLVAQADAARKLGEFDKADVLLARAAHMATEDAQRIQQQALESTRQAASLTASRATLALTRLDRKLAASLFEKAFALRRFDASSETVWWLFEAGDALIVDGQTQAAGRIYELAQATAAGETVKAPDSAQSQRDLSVSYNKIGDVQRANGDAPAALKSFQASLAIRERLVAKDAGNTEWQRDLSVSYNKIGDVQRANGDAPAALKSYQAVLVIAERLAAKDAGNAQWQRDLSVSYDRIGDVQRANGDAPAALKSFQAGLAIAERLAAKDAGNADWQRDVVVSYWKLNQLGAVAGSTNERRALLQRGLAILIAQRNGGKLPAASTGWVGMFEKAIAELR
jgi:tetratricopeptide (TPR) repeat protein